MTELRTAEEETWTFAGITRGCASHLCLLVPWRALRYSWLVPNFLLVFPLDAARRLRQGTNGMTYLFEDYSLDTERRELRRGTDLIGVEPQVFDLLLLLIRNRTRVVSRDDLIAEVWNGRIVSESALYSRITAARQAIGDSGEAQRLIRTVARKGLRFVADVREAHSSELNAPVGHQPPPYPIGPVTSTDRPAINCDGGSQPLSQRPRRFSGRSRMTNPFRPTPAPEMQKPLRPDQARHPCQRTRPSPCFRSPIFPTIRSRNISVMEWPKT